MNIRIAVLGLAAILLSACTDQDWNHALSYVGANDQPAAAAPAPQRPAPQPAAARAAPPAPVQQAQAPKLNSFCENVAKQDSEGNDFDAPTQQRVFIRSYQQCVAIFGDASE
jgi:hypothetical protein